MVDEEQGDLNLLKLAADLRSRPEGFDYGTLRANTPCGTVACALGRMPEVFPGEVVVRRLGFEDFSIASAAEWHSEPIAVACYMFALDSDEQASHLFYPGGCMGLPAPPLPCNATADLVARHIEDFVAKRRAKRVAA